MTAAAVPVRSWQATLRYVIGYVDVVVVVVAAVGGVNTMLHHRRCAAKEEDQDNYRIDHLYQDAMIVVSLFSQPLFSRFHRAQSANVASPPLCAMRTLSHNKRTHYQYKIQKITTNS